MSETEYTYSITGSFPNGSVNGARLVQEIAAAGIAVKAWVNTEGDLCKIVFVKNVDSQEATLKEVVSVHDGAESTEPPYFHASSTIVGPSVAVITPAPDWQEVGGIVTTPSFFTASLDACKGRIVGEYKCDSDLVIRTNEDGVEKGRVELASTDGLWSKLNWFVEGHPTEGTHTYCLECQTSGRAEVRFCSLTLLEFR